MRPMLSVLAFLMMLYVSSTASASSAATGPAAITAPTSAFATDAQDPPIKVNVDIDKGGRWYMSPVWMAIGGIALVVIILLIVMASRGGGTTVVRG